MFQLVDLDTTDLEILMELQMDGRMNYAEISRRTGIPSSTVYDKITRLVNRGVIKKFTVILDREKVGFAVSYLTKSLYFEDSEPPVSPVGAEG